MNYIGIDFSMNSAAVSINCCDFLAYYRYDIPKRYQEDFKNQDKIQMVKLESFLDFGEYSINELHKVRESINLADLIFNEIEKYDDIICGIEGFSYNGLSKRSLDLAGFQYLLRERLLNSKKIKQFYIFTPGEIKKYAIKGTATKHQMIEAYLELNIDNNLTELITTGNIKKYNASPKPIDDLVDSWYIGKLAERKFLEEN